MKKINTYILSAFAALVMLPLAVSAQTGEVKQSKTVADNGDGTYTVTLESYVTGETVSSAADIVLVLDNSNSMYSYELGSQSGTSDSSTKNRAYALKEAVSDFLDNLAATGLNHNVAIVKFEGGGRRIDHYYNDFIPDNLHAYDIADGFFNIQNATKRSAAETAVNSMSKSQTDTGTPAADGLYLANQMLSSLDDNNPKIVIFFTDGCCGTSETWGKDEGGNYYKSGTYTGYPSGYATPNRYYAQKVVQQANVLKSNDVKVFCVGTFGFKTTSTASDNMRDTYFYLRHISSAYNNDIVVTGDIGYTPVSGKIEGQDSDGVNYRLPEKTGTGTHFTNPFVTTDGGNDISASLANDKYIFPSDNKTALISAFNTICEEIVKSVDLGPGSAVAIDAMTDQFELPDNVTEDDIKLYTSDATVTGTAPNLNISWGPRAAWKPWTTVAGKTITDYISINPASSKAGIEFDSDYLEVTGYDYKSHFVGLDNDNGSQKLIIEFLIKAAPSNRGGLKVHTNDVHSGIYNKKDGSDDYELVIAYDKPTVNLPYLKIVKKGLKKGESALFSVTKVTDAGAVVTGDNAYSATVMVSQADDTGVASATIKLVFNGYYKVEELSWSNLGYTVVKHDTDGSGNCTVTGNSYIRQMNTIGTGVARELVYTFENAAGVDRPDHAEDYVPNDMGVTESTPMTGGGSGDTPASGAPEENPGGPIGF